MGAEKDNKFMGSSLLRDDTFYSDSSDLTRSDTTIVQEDDLFKDSTYALLADALQDDKLEKHHDYIVIKVPGEKYNMEKREKEKEEKTKAKQNVFTLSAGYSIQKSESATYLLPVSSSVVEDPDPDPIIENYFAPPVVKTK